MQDLVIIGAGGGGFTAGLYAGRYGLKPIVLGANEGGMINENPVVENFPGFDIPTSGFDIMQKLKKQAIEYGTDYKMDTVTEVLPLDETNFEKGYKIKTQFNGEIEAKSVILGIGTEKNKIGVEGEDEFFGKGVSYCATCDGFFYKGKTTAVIGGGDSAFIEALYLSNICEKVYLIHRRDSFKAEAVRVEKAKQKANIEFILNAQTSKIYGSNLVEGIEVNQEGEKVTKKVDGVFIAIGMTPNKLAGLDNFLERDEKGYIKVSSCTATNLPGVFAIGDCSTGNCGFRQLVVACAEGAVSAENAFKYISKH